MDRATLSRRIFLSRSVSGAVGLGLFGTAVFIPSTAQAGGADDFGDLAGSRCQRAAPSAGVPVAHRRAHGSAGRFDGARLACGSRRRCRLRDGGRRLGLRLERGVQWRGRGRRRRDPIRRERERRRRLSHPLGHDAQLRRGQDTVADLALLRGDPDRPGLGMQPLGKRIPGHRPTGVRRVPTRGRRRRSRPPEALSDRGPHRQPPLPLHTDRVPESRSGPPRGRADPRPERPGRDRRRPVPPARLARRPRSPRRRRPRPASRSPPRRASTAAKASTITPARSTSRPRATTASGRSTRTTNRIEIRYALASTPRIIRSSSVDNVFVAAERRHLRRGGSRAISRSSRSPTTGGIKPIVQVMGQSGSEITGPALSPDGRRLYFSSQRNPGTTYEVEGPFLGPAASASGLLSGVVLTGALGAVAARHLVGSLGSLDLDAPGIRDRRLHDLRPRGPLLTDRDARGRRPR